jgi:hypothetical protein
VAARGLAGALTMRWLMILRAAVTLQAVALLVQAVTAGRLLSSPDGRDAHAATAVIVTATVLLQLVAAALYWRPGRGNPRILVSSILQLPFVAAQFMLADAHNKLLHVPVGVLLFGFSMLLVGQVWRRPEEVPA